MTKFPKAYTFETIWSDTKKAFLKFKIVFSSFEGFALVSNKSDLENETFLDSLAQNILVYRNLEVGFVIPGQGRAIVISGTATNTPLHITLAELKKKGVF